MIFVLYSTFYVHFIGLCGDDICTVHSMYILQGCAVMISSVVLMPYWFAYIVEIFIFYFINLTLCISMAISIARLLSIVQVKSTTKDIITQSRERQRI